MILGIVIGVLFMCLLVLAYMAGYGMAAQKNNPNTDEEE